MLLPFSGVPCVRRVMTTFIKPCHICEKELADKCHLDIHLLLYGEATYSCEFCGFRYKTEPALKLHKKNTHLEKMIVCEYCSKMIPVPCKLCCCVSFDLCKCEKRMIM